MKCEICGLTVSGTLTEVVAWDERHTRRHEFNPPDCGHESPVDGCIGAPCIELNNTKKEI